MNHPGNLPQPAPVSTRPSIVVDGEAGWLADIEHRAANADALWKEAGAPGPDKCDRVAGSTQYGAMMALRRLAKDMRTVLSPSSTSGEEGK